MTIKQYYRDRQAAQRLSRRLQILPAIAIIGLIIFMIFTILMSDAIERRKSDYLQWEESVMYSNYLTADDFFTKVESYTTPLRDNVYGVAYRGVAKLSDCVYLYDLCDQNGVPGIVTQTTLPNGVLARLELTVDDLYNMVYSVNAYDALAGLELTCTTDLFQHRIERGSRATLDAFWFRQFQDWNAHTGQTFIMWRASLTVISVFIFAILAILIILLGNRWSRRLRILRRRISRWEFQRDLSRPGPDAIITLEGATYELLPNSPTPAE